MTKYIFMSFYLGWIHMATAGSVGVIDNQLRPCPDKPNCVCSFEQPSSSHYVEPLKLSTNPIPSLSSLLKSNGFEIITENQNYIHATEKSSFFKFIDDVELLYDEDKGLLHFRSASQTGYYDLGVNQKRVKKLKALIEKSL